MRPLPEAPDQRAALPYHQLTSVFHLVDLADEVNCQPAQRFTLTCAGQGLDRLPVSENLGWKAARAFAEATGRELPALHIHIEKHIPPGAGLGGGSTDAAAVLLLLADACGAGAAPDQPEPQNHYQIKQIAASLGADVAFFLADSAACLMGGIGEQLLETLRPAAGTPAVIAWDASAPVSTPQVYTAFDQHTAPLDLAGQRALVEALSLPANPEPKCADIEQLGSHLYNNLSVAAFTISPAARKVHEFLSAAPQTVAAALSGSGGASFALCASTADRDALAASVRAAGYAARATKLTGQTLIAQLARDQEVGRK